MSGELLLLLVFTLLSFFLLSFSIDDMSLKSHFLIVVVIDAKNRHHSPFYCSTREEGFRKGWKATTLPSTLTQ